METVAEFARLVARDAPSLDRALALIAATGRPQVDPDGIVSAIDALAATCPRGSTHRLCAALFGPGAFVGNRDDYYDPANSLLDLVMERRTGIPITLSVLAMEVGRRTGSDLVGVGMPGHFLVRDADDDSVFHDPFSGGALLDRTGCRAVFQSLHGRGTPFHDRYLEPTGTGDIIVRVLNKLGAARERVGDRAGLAAVLRLQSVLPGAADLRAERARRRAHLN